MPIKTSELCNLYPELVQMAEPVFRNYGDRSPFGGQMVCLRSFDDVALVRQALQRLGKGKVLVVDAGASWRCALLDETLAKLAHYNAWEGIVVNGAVRDTEEIASLDLGILARFASPRPGLEQMAGQTDVPLFFAGLHFVPGQWLYADADGLLVATKRLH